MPAVAHYDLTCWYLNLRRVVELLGPASVPDFSPHASPVDRMRSLAHCKNKLVDWIGASQTPTLGQLILTGNLQRGASITHCSNFYCKGLSPWHLWREGDKEPSQLPEIYSKLDDLKPGLRVRAEYHPEHLVSNSSWSTLSGQERLFLFGMISQCSGSEIKVIPYTIASLLAPSNSNSPLAGHLISRMEIHPSMIDAFRAIRDLPCPKESELLLLSKIPETDVKHAFAEIIGEPHVPKDWGGERSDLFTTRVTVERQQLSTAFAFKGPSKFQPLTMAGLGKNGDQIDRLFTEPADLLVLQHCHRIDPSVRGAMRAYANQMGNLRLFSLIDGFDTLRILRAYSKLGFSP